MDPTSEDKARREAEAEAAPMEVEELRSRPTLPGKDETEVDNATNKSTSDKGDSKMTQQRREPTKEEEKEEDTPPKMMAGPALPPMQTHSTDSRRKSRTHGLKALPSYYQPCKEDVICAKGNDAKNHPGNQVLRSLIRSHLEEYEVLESRTDRAFIVSTIVNQIKKEGGRFVRRHKDGWADVGARNSREKIGASFRDLLHEQYSSSAKAKASRRKQQQHEADALKASGHKVAVTTKVSAVDMTPSKANPTRDAETRGSANLATSKNAAAGQDPMLSRIAGRGNFPPSYMAASALSRFTIPQHLRRHHQVLPRAHLHHLCQTLDATTEAQAVAQAQAVQAARLQAAQVAQAQQTMLQQAHSQLSFPQRAQAGIVPPPPPHSGGATVNSGNGRAFPAAGAGPHHPFMRERSFAKLSEQFRAEAAAKIGASRAPAPQEPESAEEPEEKEEEEEEEEHEVEEVLAEEVDDNNNKEEEEEDGEGGECQDTPGDGETNNNFNGFSQEAIAAATFLAGRRMNGAGGADAAVRNVAALAAASACQPSNATNPAYYYGAGVSPEAVGRPFFMPSAAAAAAMAAMQGGSDMIYPTAGGTSTPRLPTFGATQKRPSLEIYIRPPKHSNDGMTSKRSCMEPEGHYVGPKSLYTREDVEDSGCASD